MQLCKFGCREYPVLQEQTYEPSVLEQMSWQPSVYRAHSSTSTCKSERTMDQEKVNINNVYREGHREGGEGEGGRWREGGGRGERGGGMEGREGGKYTCTCMPLHSTSGVQYRNWKISCAVTIVFVHVHVQCILHAGRLHVLPYLSYNTWKQHGIDCKYM